MASPKAVDCTEFIVRKPTILVIGSEGKGLRSTVLSACTDLVQINSALSEATQTHSTVDSLNASVAAGILIHQMVSKAAWQEQQGTVPVQPIMSIAL